MNTICFGGLSGDKSVPNFGSFTYQGPTHLQPHRLRLRGQQLP